MFSFEDADAVMAELGDKVLGALVQATRGARDDWAEICAWRPEWVAEMFERDKASLIHSRIWSRLELLLDGVPHVVLTSREPLRELVVSTPTGRTYAARVKRHDDRDRIASYPTRSDIAFWGGGEAVTFDGMERVNLAAGYRWDAEKNHVGEPVLSFRQGKTNVIWSFTIEDGGVDGTEQIRWSPVDPQLPTVDLRRAVDVELQEGSAR